MSHGVSFSRYKPNVSRYKAKPAQAVKNPNQRVKGTVKGIPIDPPKSHGYDPNKVDKVQAREIQLQMENDSNLYRQRLVPTYKNQVNKIFNGSYDADLANKQYNNVVTDWERAHRQDVGRANKDTRAYVANEMRESFETDAKFGNWDNQLHKKNR